MTHLLLAGAGFTHNWKGWLAKEMEGDRSRPKVVVEWEVCS
jgi:hypothetical protein